MSDEPRVFTIPEADLATLEAAVATLAAEVPLPTYNGNSQVHQACLDAKRILSDVRFVYRPDPSTT
jgi:hypothetical protein